MAFTSADLESINAALAGGEMTAKVGDRLVTYRSVDELLRVKMLIESEIAAQPHATPRFGAFRLGFATQRGY